MNLMNWNPKYSTVCTLNLRRALRRYHAVREAVKHTPSHTHRVAPQIIIPSHKVAPQIDVRYAEYYKFPVNPRTNGRGSMKSCDANDPSIVRAYWNDLLD